MNKIIYTIFFLYLPIYAASFEEKNELLTYAKEHNLSMPSPDHRNCYLTQNKRGVATPQTDPISSTFCANILKESNPQTVLEVGCAYGLLAHDILKVKNNVEYTAIDPNLEHLAIATQSIEQINQTAFDHWHPIAGSFGHIKLPDNRYDHIGLFSVIHYFSPQELITSLQEIEKSLKPKGKAYIFTLHFNTMAYGACLQDFYKENVAKGIPYPGFIENTKEFVKSYAAQGTFPKEKAASDSFLNSLAPYNLFLDTTELINIINRETGLIIEYASTIDSFLYTSSKNGQKYIGIIMRKPHLD